MPSSVAVAIFCTPLTMATQQRVEFTAGRAEEADDGFFEWSSSDEENYSGCWPPPGRRRRHPAGNGIIYTPPFATQLSAPSPKPTDDTPTRFQRITEGDQFTFNNFPLRSEDIPIPPQTAASTTDSSGFSSPPLASSPEDEPLCIYMLRRFFESGKFFEGDSDQSGGESR